MTTNTSKSTNRETQNCKMEKEENSKSLSSRKWRMKVEVVLTTDQSLKIKKFANS
jgi:hypothetical protein